MRKLFLTFLLIAFILPACSEAPTATLTKAPPRATYTPIPARPTPNAAELEITDPKKTMEVTAGSEFTITVKTFIDPDFHWEVAEELDSKIVEYVWKDHVPDKPDNPNSSGRDVWRFKAVGPGTTTITLGYYQGTTLNANPMRVFTIVVK